MEIQRLHQCVSEKRWICSTRHVHFFDTSCYSVRQPCSCIIDSTTPVVMAQSACAFQCLHNFLWIFYPRNERQHIATRFLCLTYPSGTYTPQQASHFRLFRIPVSPFPLFFRSRNLVTSLLSANCSANAIPEDTSEAKRGSEEKLHQLIRVTRNRAQHLANLWISLRR